MMGSYEWDFHGDDGFEGAIGGPLGKRCGRQEKASWVEAALVRFVEKNRGCFPELAECRSLLRG